MELQLQKIEQAAKAGVDWVQLREKDLSGRELAKLAGHALLRAGNRSMVLVNDRVDVAFASGAAGVHLGEQSLPPDQAKKLARQRNASGNFIVGVSTHSLERAIQAQQGGADYVIFGPIYPTPSKEGFGKPQGVQRLQDVCRAVTIPVLAIGGITLENAGHCLVAGDSERVAKSLLSLAGSVSPLESLSRHQPAKQADLSGVVNVMKSHAVECRKKFFRAGSLQHSAHSRFQSLVFPFEQRQISQPSRFGCFALFRAWEEIAPLETE
jgi:thiamine-phosphate pyrophosphorylase